MISKWSAGWVWCLTPSASAEVNQVLETLLSKHGLEPSAVKSDLYTLAGIDSNHPSKLRSTIWRPYEVILGGKEAVEVSLGCP
jgi:hypothetical protein